MTLFSWSTPPAEAGVESILGSSLATVLGWIVAGRKAQRATPAAPVAAAAAAVTDGGGRAPNVLLGPTVFHPPGAVRLMTPEEEAAFR